MELRFLDFDTSEDEHGHEVFDALASVRPDQLAALQAEITTVLGWAFEHFGEVHGPLDDGGEWDHTLGGAQEFSVPLAPTYDPDTRQLALHPGPAGVPRHSLGLTLTGTPAFCAAFREAFGLVEG